MAGKSDVLEASDIPAAETRERDIFTSYMAFARTRFGWENYVKR